jgi:hypothetical protein
VLVTWTGSGGDARTVTLIPWSGVDLR